MKLKEITNKVKAINLPQNSYVVFGSCPLVAFGLREAKDIDLLVSKEVYEKLKSLGWEKTNKGPKDIPLVNGVFEVHNNWNFSSYNPTLQHLLSSAIVIDGIPFASLDEVRKWKAASGRPKDLSDIELIDKYLNK